MKRLLAVLLFFIFTGFTLNDFLGQSTLIYQEQIVDKITPVTWNIKVKESDITIDKFYDADLTHLEYSANFEHLLQLHYTASKLRSDYTFYLENGYLKASGLSNGKRYSDSFKLNLPWIQDFYFGFKNFLKSSSTTIEFYILNPKDFTPIKMCASKEGLEEISINDQPFLTQKLKITLTGFKKHFWKSEAWYDLEHQTLLKYVANEGPRTPNAITTLGSVK